MKRLLILGGTGEAAALLEAALARFGARLEITTSMAGRTSEPRVLPGTRRTGGFGGWQGLARWLLEERISMVVDATHPYATQISANTRAACRAAGVPRMILWRPPWIAEPGDNWIPAANAEEAAAMLPGLGERVFLALGSGESKKFRNVRTVSLVSRVAEAPEPHTAPPGFVVVQRGPFDVEDEMRLLQMHDIDLLVSRNSGGTATVGKIIAARRRGIPVIMLARPAPEAGERSSDLEDILEWIARKLD